MLDTLAKRRRSWVEPILRKTVLSAEKNARYTSEATSKLGLNTFRENICSDVQSKIASYTSKAMKKLVLTKFTKNGSIRPTKENAR